jgi:hypothetical protein
MYSEEVQRDEHEGRVSSQALEIAMWIGTPIFEHLERRQARYNHGVMYAKTRDIRHLVIYTELLLWPRHIRFQYMVGLLDDAR